MAQKLKVPIRCVLFTATPKLCEHNDTFRALNIGPEVSLPAKPPPMHECRKTHFAHYFKLTVTLRDVEIGCAGHLKILKILLPHGETPMLTSDLQQKTNRESRTILPHVAFSGFASRYREPKLSEGFADIIKTDFQVRVIQNIPRGLGCRNVTWANRSMHLVV